MATKKKRVADHYEQVEIRSREELRQWLAANHERDEGVWLVHYKKHSEHYVAWSEIVDECLCFGWIDSLVRKLDEDRSMHLMTPRKAGSIWSKVNKDKVKRLERAGLMTDAGRAVIERAKADGSWTFLDAVEALEIPDDLATEFARYRRAAANFEAFPRSAKRGILEWIQNAKRDPTRRKRVEETARLAQRGERANQWPRKS